VACVDERKSFDAVVRCQSFTGGGAVLTVNLYGIDCSIDVSLANPDAIIINQQLLQTTTLGATNTIAWEFQGRSYGMLALQVTADAGTALFQARITATDN